MKAEKKIIKTDETKGIKKKWETPVLNKKDIKETLNSLGGGGDVNGRATS